jgi:hypothetical protein
VRACLEFLRGQGISALAEIRTPDLRRFLADEATHRPAPSSQARTVAALRWAVIGTAVAVSELGTVRVGRVVAAAAPSMPDVLLPAVAGAASGVLVLAAITALWGACSYFKGGFKGGDDNWQALVAPLVSGQGVCAILYAKPEALVDQSRLGSIEVVARWPSGTFYRSAASRPAPHPYAVVHQAISDFTEPGTYLVRWYATEHKARLHEVARAEHTVS